MNPNGAIFGDSDVHLDDYQLTSVVEDRRAIRDFEAKAKQKIAEIGSLKNHAGWLHIRGEFEKDIENFRSGAVLKELAYDGKTTDEELGKELRVMMMVADRLEKRIKEVEMAAEADMQNKMEKKNVRI